MEQNVTNYEERKGQNIAYSHASIDDKHYFGGFFNLAQNNIEAVRDAFKERFEITHKNWIIEAFKDDIASTDYQNRIDYLKKYFPVIGYLDDENDYQNRKVNFREKFEKLINAVNSYRHFYTHFYHAPISISGLTDFLDEIFLEVTTNVKRTKMKSDKTKHLLKENLSEELDILMKNKKEELHKKKKENKKIATDDISVRNAVLNDAFEHLLYKDDVSKFYRSNQKETTDNRIDLSQTGVLFLLGLFLSKKESDDLRSRVKGFKAKIIDYDDISKKNNSLKFMATHWVFSHLSYKGMKQKLSTTFSKETLLMQIIDELSKVPDEVYVTFTKEKQDEFVEDMNEYMKDGKELKSLEEMKVVHPVIRKRYENKFNYFVLRYLDEFAEFPTLRFQIHLGNYVHDRRNKPIKTSNIDYDSDRVIKEKIKVFGNLSDVSELKDEFVESKYDEESDTGWEIFPKPSYNLVGNNIPIYFEIKDKRIVHKVEEVTKERNESENRKERKNGKPNKNEIVDIINKNNKMIISEPTAFLSLNELPALLYELLFNKTKPKDIEKNIRDKHQEHFQAIKDYPNDNSKDNEVPKTLKRSGSQEIINKKKLLNAIDSELEITQEKLDLIKNNKEELNSKDSKRKYLFTTKELGQEATWLADDLKRFMPKEGREKWKGYYHSELQKALSFYNYNQQEPMELLQDYWDFEDGTYLWNKKIKEAFEARSFDLLYTKYLQKRMEIFKAFKENIKDKENKLLKKYIDQQNLWNIFHKRFYVLDSTEDKKNKLLAKPLVFPRGIFDEKPTYIKGENIKKSPEKYAEWFKFANEYDSFQTFYNENIRDYKDLFEKTKNEHPEFQKNKKDLTNGEKFIAFKNKQNREIRKIQTQDLFLKLIAEDLFKKIFDDKITIDLKEVFVSRKERLERKKRAKEQSGSELGDKSANTYLENHFWKKTVPYEDKNVYEPKVMLKDFGKFKRLLDDERVKTIFEYKEDKKETKDEDEKWTKDKIESEIDTKPFSYEAIRREKIFKLIQQFEKSILKDNGVEISDNFKEIEHPNHLEKDNNPKFSVNILNGVIRKVFPELNSETDWLVNNVDFNKPTKDSINQLKSKHEEIKKAFILIIIRNKFGHNQLPSKAVFDFIKEIYPENNFNSYAQYYLYVVEQVINFFKK